MDYEIFISSGVWIITSLLMLAGITGSVFPGLPGSSLILVGYGWHYYASGDNSGASIWGAIIFLVLWFLTLIIDYVAGVFGAKLFGGSKWGMLGAFVGTIVGVIVLNIPGLFVGPLVGTALFEYMLARQKFKASLKSGTGSLLGAIFSMVINVAFSALMICTFVIDEIW